MALVPPSKVAVVNEQDRGQVEHAVFHRHLTDSEYAALAGVCRPETDVTITFEKEGFRGIAIKVKAESPKRWSLSVICVPGEVILHSVSVDESLRDKGLAREMFFHHARTAKALGFKRILGDLKRFPKGHAAGEHDGYYKGARWGFNAPLSESVRNKLPVNLSHAKCLHDLVGSDAGIKFWKVNGERVPNAEFNLNTDSDHWKILGIPGEATGQSEAK